MRGTIATVALVLMVIGLLLTAFGTRTIPSNQSSSSTTCDPQALVCDLAPTPSSFSGLGCDISGAPCPPAGVVFVASTPTPIHLDFTLNYIGGLMAILSAIGFAVALPTKRNGSVVGPDLNVLPLY